MARIVCYRTGVVYVSRTKPKGAMCLIVGHGTRLKRVLKDHARVASDGVTLVIPEVADAANDLEAALAAKAFELVLFKALAASPWRGRGGG